MQERLSPAAVREQQTADFRVPPEVTVEIQRSEPASQAEVQDVVEVVRKSAANSGAMKSNGTQVMPWRASSSRAEASEYRASPQTSLSAASAPATGRATVPVAPVTSIFLSLITIAQYGRTRLHQRARGSLSGTLPPPRRPPLRRRPSHRVRSDLSGARDPGPEHAQPDPGRRRRRR